MGDTVYDRRDRAIVKFYIYSAASLAAGCRLRVEDFQKDQDGATIRIAERGARRRTIGLHFAAATYE
jgi:integrase